MRCKNCGTELVGTNTELCPNCINNANVNNGGIKFIPSFILGLIGSFFGISGGFCMTMCTSLYSSGMSAFLLIFGGSIVGLVGACKCLKDAKKGSILELIGAIMIIICAYGITGSDISTVFGMLLLLIGGIIGLIYSISKTKK